VKERKGFQTKDMTSRMKTDPPVPVKSTAGMKIGETRADAQAELIAKATDAELKVLADLVAKRTAGQTMTWCRCDKCGAVGLSRAGSEGQACGKCNWRSLSEGGHLRRMTDAAVVEFQKARVAAESAALFKLDSAGFAARNHERDTAGLPRYTMAEFRAERDGAFKRRAEAERRMGQTYADAEIARRAK
jgi:hypothetical protein